MRKDWLEIELGSVLKTTSGGTPSRSKPNFYSGNIPWVKSGELNENTILETEEYISEEAVKNSSAKVFPKGTLLIALYGATIGKLAFLGIEAATNQAVCGIFENKAIQPRFLYYYLFHNRRKLIEQGTGGAQPNISQTILKKLPIKIAPLPEQRAIVGRIEELFSELDHSIANLKAAKTKLEVYRQAVLKKAFEGGYTKDSKNLWKIVKFGEATLNFDGKRKPLSRAYRENFKGEYPYYGACEIIDYVKDFLFDGEYLLIGEDGANLLSKSKPLSFIAEGKFWVNNHAHVIQPKKGLDIRFLCYQFNSLQINEYVTGTAQPKLSQGNLNKIPLKVCGIEEQTQIVQEIESRLSVADKLAETIQTNLEKAEALRQSILKKAFEGKLLSEAEIEACRKEADWGPAERLVERIKSELNKPKKS